MLADLSNNCSKEYSFSDFWEVSSVIFELESVWERFVVKNTALLTLLLLVKYLKNFWIIGLLITSGIVVFSLISNVASDALIPLLVVLAEIIARISNIFGASQARHMDTVKKSVRNVDILVLFIQRCHVTYLSCYYKIVFAVLKRNHSSWIQWRSSYLTPKKTLNISIFSQNFQYDMSQF